MNKIKLAITLTPKILEAVTRKAAEAGLSRSAYIEQVIRRYLEEVDR